MNIKKMSAIGSIIIVISLVVFSVAILSISRDTGVYTVNLSPQASENISRYAGLDDLISYRITFNNVTGPLSSYLISPTGIRSPYHSSPLNTTGNVVADESGLWSLYILNTGNRTIQLTVELTVVPESTMFTVLAAFTLLPIGIVILIFNPVKNRIEKFKNTRRKV
ncbi:hypothetical protein [Thermoplasma acidophilum]|uniref:hypothetical protein n=1 Tax=Thermoplasma acidophilum TaxID=2303 RepID=UPI00064F98B4|nr:hypothetical protein [Thermoplasma acidophilum]MCY0851607.1 hypothetical protein [Thermoplasma acidophilum]